MSHQPLAPARTTETGSSAFPSFQQEMNRLLEQLRNNFSLLGDTLASPLAGSAFPAIDVVETDTTFEVTAELPGVKREELDVSVIGKTLVLKGQKTATHEQKEDGFHVVERQYGSFRRQVPLDFTPADGTVDAGFEDGVLMVVIAKPAEAKAEVQKINIKKN